MPRNRNSFFLIMILLGFLLFACAKNNPVCPSDEGTPHPTLKLADLIDLPPPASASSAPLQVEIQGKEIEVDKLVDYPLCNDNWSGTVYVSCNVQVSETDKDTDSNPLFLKGCNLNIAPNTVVYVASHNDTPYYNGCSCHTGEPP